MDAAKETASNLAANAKCAADKTKAEAEEKHTTLTSNNPAEKEAAKVQKEVKLAAAEAEKKATTTKNAAAKKAHDATGA